MQSRLGALIIGGICVGLPMFVIGQHHGATQERRRLLEIGTIQKQQQPWKQDVSTVRDDLEVAHARVEAVKYVMDIVAKQCPGRARAPRPLEWPKRPKNGQP